VRRMELEVKNDTKQIKL